METTEKKIVHVFDVDGTILQGDSLLRLLIFTQKNFLQMAWQIISISPLLIFNKHQLAKEKWLSAMFKGKSKTEVSQICSQYFKYNLKFQLRPKALEKIIELNENKQQIILLSASCDVWLNHLSAYLSADLICSKLGFDDKEICTGKLSTPNCKGQEKIKRLLEKYPSQQYEFICYGNSKSDKILQTISKQFYYRYF